MDLAAGQSVGLVHEIKPAGEIVAELVAGAQRILSASQTGRAATEAGRA